MLKENVVDIIEEVVNKINKTVTVDNWESLGNKRFKAFIKNTRWIRNGFKYSIDGKNYKAEEVKVNEYVIFKAATSGNPTNSTSFTLPLFYKHGTIRQTNTEVSSISNFKDKYPLVYLHENIQEKYNPDRQSKIALEADLRLFFLDSIEFEQWLTDDYYKELFNPFKSLVNEFLKVIETDRKTFSKLEDTYTIIRHTKFSTTSSNGNENFLFSDNIGGIELRINIPINRKHCSC